MPAGSTASGLRELLHGAVDYAGLFPPAKLAMEPAVRNYAQYRRVPDAWMLGRFICPAARLDELTPFLAELFPQGPALTVSALGRGGATTAEFLANLRKDLDDVAAFRRAHPGQVVVDAYEAKLPGDVTKPGQGHAVAGLAGAAAELIEKHGPPMLMPYYEAGMDGDWRLALEAVFAGLEEDASSDAAEGRGRSSPAGFKLRTGGLEAAAFPSPEQVAFVLTGCARHGLALKFTAGLHHPVRAFHASVQTKMHGFLNVLLAALFAYAAIWPEAELARLLEDEDATQFQAHEDGVGWRNYALDAPAIHRLRQEFGLSFGSCSFDEPREDLRTLGML